MKLVKILSKNKYYFSNVFIFLNALPILFKIYEFYLIPLILTKINDICIVTKSSFSSTYTLERKIINVIVLID